MGISFLKSIYCFFLAAVFGSVGQLQADLITYVIDPNASSLTFDFDIIVPTVGGPVTLPFVVDPGTPGDNLTTRLSGSFTADPGLNTLGSGGPIVQLDNLQGSVFDPFNARVGGLGVSNQAGDRFEFALLALPSNLVVQQGKVTYAVASATPPLNLVGSVNVAGGLLSVGAPAFATLPGGQSTVDYTIGFNGLLPTVNPTVFLNARINGNIRGVQAVPEPSALLPLIGLTTVLAGLGRRRRLPQTGRYEARTWR